MIRPTCERLENEVGLEHPLEIKEFQHAPDSVHGSNGYSGIISALKHNGTITQSRQPPASGTRSPSRALPRTLFMGIVAGVNVRFYTRDVEGQALKPGENGLRVPPVRDIENNTYPFGVSE